MTITHKYSNVSNKVPNNLKPGQIAINTVQGQIYTQDSAEVRELYKGYHFYIVADITARGNLVLNKEIFPMQYCQYINASTETQIDLWTGSEWKTIEESNLKKTS